jgi:hypothetical protein
MAGEILIPSSRGQFCSTPTVGNRQPVTMEKPPIDGYNYNSVILTELVSNPGQAYPLATTTTTSVFRFPVKSSIVGLWLATSIVNPNAVSCGAFVGKINQEKTVIDLGKAANLYFQHISKSANTISRTGGLAFGEQSGLNVNTDEQIGVYLTGSDASLQILYALSIVWITSN